MYVCMQILSIAVIHACMHNFVSSCKYFLNGCLHYRTNNGRVNYNNTKEVSDSVACITIKLLTLYNSFL